jgi:glycosyltransferase involved in cell wall biosynthesis
MRMRVDQILAGYADGDAVSMEARTLQELLRQRGVESEVYVDQSHVSDPMRPLSRPLEAYTAQPGDVVIHHYSIDTPALASFVASPARKIIIYHNITPEEHFVGFDDAVAAQLRQARAKLREVLKGVDAAWGVSEYNTVELREMGARNAAVFPLLFDPAAFDTAPDPCTIAKFAEPMQNILYVGRIAPNKRIEMLMHAFAFYNRVINRHSRLIIVGSERSAWRYFTMLRLFESELDLTGVFFEGFVEPGALAAYYRLADLFVSTSEHEGFCLPLVEAMHNNIPVIARRTGGTPEAMGGAGVLFEDAKPEELAALMGRVLNDAALRAEVLASQQQRLAALRHRDPASELVTLMATIGVTI